ncbi:MAG: hypothetical protein HEQ35_17860 [Gloeotrichia echinulata IR180]|nr:hypothetical protein [Gloeotrichia echinulata DEX184]
MGIALLVRTLRVACFHVVVRLRSVTRDWGLGTNAYMFVTNTSTKLMNQSVLVSYGFCLISATLIPVELGGKWIYQ